MGGAGYVCVRGFDRETRAPKPLVHRLHFQAAKSVVRSASVKNIKTWELEFTWENPYDTELKTMYRDSCVHIHLSFFMHRQRWSLTSKTYYRSPFSFLTYQLLTLLKWNRQIALLLVNTQQEHVPKERLEDHLYHQRGRFDQLAHALWDAHKQHVFVPTWPLPQNGRAMTRPLPTSWYVHSWHQYLTSKYIRVDYCYCTHAIHGN